MAIRLISYFRLGTIFLFLHIVLERFTVAMERRQKLSITSSNRPSTLSHRHLTPLRLPLTLTHYILTPPHRILIQFRAYHCHLPLLLSRFSTASSFFNAFMLHFSASLLPLDAWCPLMLSHRPLAPPHHTLFPTYHLFLLQHRFVALYASACAGLRLLFIVNEVLTITL